MTLPEICGELQELQMLRRFAIKAQQRSDRSIEGFIARVALGYRSPRERVLDKKAKAEAEKLFKEAAAIRRRVERGDGGKDHTDTATHHGAVNPVIAGMIVKSAMSRVVWDGSRDDSEKKMKNLAKQTPVWPLFKDVKGFGELSLGIIIGEAGDLNNFATPAKLWKYLGLAVIDGQRQRRVKDKDEAEKHKYNPQRHAHIWTVGSALIKWQLQSDGPYAKLYNKKRDEYIARGEIGGKPATPKHIQNAATRYMLKQLVKHVWTAWREVTQELPEAAD